MQAITTPQVNFVDSIQPEGSVVRRSGKIFEAGSYPSEHGQFVITEQDLIAARDSFAPVPVDLDHKNTVLDGKLGTLESVDVSEDGRILFGTIALPEWLNNVLGDGIQKVSCTWDFVTKKLAGIALTKTPRITDAAIFSAYAAFTASQPTIKEKKMSFKDLVSKYLADKSDEEVAALAPRMFALFATDNEDNPTPLSPEPAPVAPPAPAPAPAPVAPAPTVPFSDNTVVELQRRLAQAEARLAQTEAERRVERATSIVDNLITTGKLMPAQRTSTLALFAQAMNDDAANPGTFVTFSQPDGTIVKTSRLAMLEASYQAAPSHNLTQEQVVAFAISGGGGNPSDKGKHQAEVDSLLALTPEGRSVLEARKK